MCFSRWWCRTSAYARATPQMLKEEKNGKCRLIWDGSTKLFWWEETMNEHTPTENEPNITFGLVILSFCTWLWNLRISFPEEKIWLAFIDISACFHYPRIVADLCGAFGYVIGPWFFAANAMVFGSVASASSWEPFRRAIAALATACFVRPWLVKKHKELLDLI